MYYSYYMSDIRLHPNEDQAKTKYFILVIKLIGFLNMFDCRSTLVPIFYLFLDKNYLRQSSYYNFTSFQKYCICTQGTKMHFRMKKNEDSFCRENITFHKMNETIWQNPFTNTIKMYQVISLFCAVFFCSSCIAIMILYFYLLHH